MRSFFNIFPSTGLMLPPLHGQPFAWFNATNSPKTYSLGITVSSQASVAGNSLLLAQGNSALQGQLNATGLNGKSFVSTFRQYGVGGVDTFRFLHDCSVPYAVFSLVSLPSQGSGYLYYTIFGGVANGVMLALNANGSLGKLIRQSDGVGYGDPINHASAAGAYPFNQFFLLADVFYGYKTADGNDQEISINNNAPALEVAECNTSVFPSANHANEFRFGNDVNTKASDLLFVTFPGCTREEIDQDLASLKSAFNSWYQLW